MVELGFDQAAGFLDRQIQFSEEDTKLLEDVRKACEDLMVPEFESYLARETNSQVADILRKHDLLGIPIAKRYNGRGANALTYALTMEKLGQIGMGVVTFLDVHSSLGQLTIEEWGTEDQKKRYLIPSTRGEKILGFALTEPEAGSDPTSLQSYFETAGDCYLLNGTKYLISNGSIADALITFAYSKNQTRKICAFIVDTDAEGFEVTMKLQEKIGLFTSDTSMIEFNRCRIPAENMIGAVGDGLRVAYSGLLNGRIGIAAGAVGVLEDCLNSTIERARTRIQHGKAIGKHQLIQRHIAEIASKLEMARWLTYVAALKKTRYDSDRRDARLRAEADLYSCIAKRAATKLAYEAADHAVQVFGGAGYSITTNVARHFCDSRVTRIYEGTDEIMELKIASLLLGKDFEAYR